MDTNNIDTRKRIMPINLQLFAEPSTSGQDPQNGHPTKSVSERVEEIFNSDATDTNEPIEQLQEGQQLEQPTNQEPQSDTPQDGTAKDSYEKRFKDAQAYTTKVSQENAQLRAQLEQLAQQNMQMQQQMQAVQQPQVQQGTQPQAQVIDPQSYMDMLYENPQGAISSEVENAINGKLAPILNFVQQQMIVDKWGRALKQFEETVPDYAENKTAIFQYINDNGLGNSDDPEGVLQKGYIAARKLNYQPPQQVDPTTYLQDENFVNQNIINNPDIVNKILKAQAEKLQQGNPPVSIASTGGQQLATPPNKPTSMEEAHDRMRSLFRQ